MKLELNYTKEEMSENERKNYCASVFAIFPIIEKDIKAKMYEQLINTYSVAVGSTRNKEERDFEIVRGNGIMEGMAVLLEKWEQASNEHIANSKGKETFDKHEVISQL